MWTEDNAVEMAELIVDLVKWRAFPKPADITDRHLFRGELPCKPPVTLGHEFSGIVAYASRSLVRWFIQTENSTPTAVVKRHRTRAVRFSISPAI